MPSNFSLLSLRWYDESNSYEVNADLTPDVTTPLFFTDTGTGEVNEAEIILRAQDGKYITTGNIIEKHDRINILCGDLGGNIYVRVFEVVRIIPSQDKDNGGTLLTLKCLGIEYHTQHIHVSKPFYYTDGFSVADDIGSMYNQNRGVRQPILTGHNETWNGSYGNALPNFTANNYDYSLYEDTAYNRWMDLIDKFGASVAAGGALKFYELSFITFPSSILALRLRESGDNTPTVTIKNAKVTSPRTVGTQEGELTIETGTNVLAWGSADHGSLPVEFSRYDSQLVQFAFRPEWSDTISYTVDAKVKVIQPNGRAKHYKSKINNNLNNIPPAFGDSIHWQRIDMKSEFGDSIQYSPWTDDKATLWKNSMANPNGSQLAWDINLVIWDEGYFRTWVDARATSNEGLDILANYVFGGYSYDSTRYSLPRGFRVLVDSTFPSGDLADFSNKVVEWDGNKWYIKYSFLPNNDKVQVAVINEAKIYEGDNFGTSPVWNALDSADFGNDCFHPVFDVTNVRGVDLVNGTPRSEINDSGRYPDITQNNTSFTKNVNSALKFTYTWNDIISSSVNSQTGDWYKRGAWACFRFPFPVNDYNGITENVGDIYGGGERFQREPATLDIQNMHLTHDGQRGFNRGSSSEDLGQINSIAFWCKLDIESGLDIDANHKMRCFMIDTSDNIVYSDFELEFSNHWQDIRLPISSFRIYRGRRPAYGLDNAITMIPPKDLDIINVFEWHNVKFIGIQYMPVYDQFGRFNPTGSILNDATPSVQVNNLAGGTISLYIDAFRFIKPLLVSSGQVILYNIEPSFLQRPDITVYDQLLNDAKSQLEIEKFQHKEFNIETSGDNTFDVKFGDSFYLENKDLINDSDNGDNTIQLVAKRIEYTISKPPNGPGGLKRRILGVKVFN